MPLPKLKDLQVAKSAKEALAYKANTTLNSKIQNKLDVIVGNHNALVVCSVHKQRHKGLR